MTPSHVLSMLFGIVIGLTPTIVQIINRKLKALEGHDPVEAAILDEAIRRLSDKKPLMKPNETVIPMSNPEKPDNTINVTGG